MYKKIFLILTSTLILAACSSDTTQDEHEAEQPQAQVTVKSYEEIKEGLKGLSLAEYLADNPSGGSGPGEVEALFGEPDNILDGEGYVTYYYRGLPEDLTLSLDLDNAGGLTHFELRDRGAMKLSEGDILSVEDDGSVTEEELEEAFGRPGVYEVFGGEKGPKEYYKYMISDTHATSFEIQEGKIVSVANPFETLRALEAQETETSETETKEPKEEAETKKEPAEDRQAQDEEVKELIQGWVAENGYTDAIVDVRVNDLIVDIMVHSVIDFYGDNQKEEIFTTLGSQLNAELVAQGYDEKDFIFYNTSENEIGSYRITVLGDYKTVLHN